MKKTRWEARPAKVGEDHPHAAFNIYAAGATASMGRIAHIPATECKPTRDHARLIAAAPELLAALEMIDTEWTSDIPEGPDFKGDPTICTIHPDHVRIWKHVRATIAMAKGGAA